MMGPLREDGVVVEGYPSVGKEEEEMWRSFLAMIRPLCGRDATAEEQAEPLVFLNSNMARFISGENICVDFGYIASVEVGQSPNVFGL